MVYLFVLCLWKKMFMTEEEYFKPVLRNDWRSQNKNSNTQTLLY